MKDASIAVTATANGYYGNKVRVPGEKFRIDSSKDFSERWMTRDDGQPNERFAATGGTDGVVGTTVETGNPAERTAAENRARELAGISDNDDRSRDFAADAGNDPAPPADEPETAGQPAANPSAEREDLKKQAKELDIEFPRNVTNEKLKELIDAKLAS